MTLETKKKITLIENGHKQIFGCKKHGQIAISLSNQKQVVTFYFEQLRVVFSYQRLGVAIRLAWCANSQI